MSELFQPPPKAVPLFQPAGVVAPQDVQTGGVDPVSPVSAILGVSNFAFDFFNEGGTNNLKPGRPTTRTASLQPPAGTTNGFICLRSITGAFVTNGGANLTERPLGEFQVDVGFAANNTLSCTVTLSDSNSDDPVKVSVRGAIVYFR